MTNFDKNIRTLIICFVIAMVALVPLRFSEIKQEVGRVRVLGEQELVEIVDLEAEEVDVYDDTWYEIENEGWGDDWQIEEEGIILPNAE